MKQCYDVQGVPKSAHSHVVKAGDFLFTTGQMGRDIDGKMKRLEKAMVKHDKEQKAEPLNWGFVGDYGHVHEQLDELVRFLNG